MDKTCTLKKISNGYIVNEYLSFTDIYAKRLDEAFEIIKNLMEEGKQHG